jgi:5-methyltetrahydropteroyltriglutamate--homocysteine methyltransferase
LDTEPIGSIPRPQHLLDALQAHRDGSLSDADLEKVREEALEDTIRRFEQTGSPVISDGEQTKPSFATYPVESDELFSPEGAEIRFSDGHSRRLPLLKRGPFRYQKYASEYLRAAKRFTSKPLKQAVIAPSALSLLYPQEGVPGYSFDSFLEDLVNEAENDIRNCFAAGAHCIQLDFTEARLSLKLDSSGGMLRDFIALNNQLLWRFTPAERQRIGVHSCAGADRDATHSADVKYGDLLPLLFQLQAGSFYIALTREPDPRRVLIEIKREMTANQRVFIGVTDPLNPEVESVEQVRDRVLEAASYIHPSQLGTTDDCGFAPFADDTSTSRDIAFRKIAARVAGTAMAAGQLKY